MVRNIFSHSDYLEKALDASWLRNEVIANNMANIDTIGFKSSRVEFESIFKEALQNKTTSIKKTNLRHMDKADVSVRPAVVQDNDTAIRMDGNNVDIESQQLDMVKNAIYYNTLIEKINMEMDRIKYAINEGR